MGATYITTDLFLKARFDLAPLDAELTEAGLFAGGAQKRGAFWTASYGSDRVRSPSDSLRRLLKAVEGLSDEGACLWNACLTRRFDIGFEGSHDRFASMWLIDVPILRRIVAVRGTIELTIYKPQSEASGPSA